MGEYINIFSKFIYIGIYNYFPDFSQNAAIPQIIKFLFFYMR